jgi:hypothetical protein
VVRIMLSFPGDTDRPFVSVDFAGQPVIAVLYAIGGWLMDLFGPMFWAVLIVGFLNAEIFLN